VKILDRYITKNLLVHLGMALGILVFVMLSAHLFRIFELMSRGMSPVMLGKVLLYLMPEVLRYALPLSLLISVVLVFSRLSADNELTALKSGGVSLWQVMFPGLVLSIMFSILCLWLSMSVFPACSYKAEQMKWSVLSEGPLSMLEGGKVTRLSKTCSVRVGSIEGGVMRDVHIYDADEKEGKLRDLTAEYGTVLSDPKQGRQEIVLHNFTLSERQLMKTDGKNKGGDEKFLSGKSLTVPLELTDMRRKKPLKRKLKMLNVKELFGEIVLMESIGESISKHLVELHTRLAFALSPLAFFLLGLPFGIRNRRSETSVGLLLCVVLALVFYAFSLLADCLEDKAALHPEYIIWIPTLLYQIGGLIAISKLSRH